MISLLCAATLGGLLVGIGMGYVVRMAIAESFCSTTDNLADLINQINLQWDESLEIGITADAGYWVRYTNLESGVWFSAEAGTLRWALEALAKTLKNQGRKEVDVDA